MSEPTRSRLPLIATGFAIVAVVCALAAVIVVLVRDRESPPRAGTIIDRRVAAADLAKLTTSVETVLESGQHKGVRVKDGELAKTLGLEPGDLLTALSGRPTMQTEDMLDSVRTMMRTNASTFYIEVVRGSAPALLRWQIDGDLRAAMRPPSLTPASPPDPWSPGSSGSLGALTPGGILPTPPATPPPADPLLDTVVEIDDRHYQLPRSTLDAWFADSGPFMRGARVVPAVRMGQPDGFKLYAIRPSSPFGRLGFQNGDTVHSVNGGQLETLDDVLDTYEKLKAARSLSVIEIAVIRRGKPVTLTYDVTK